MLVINNNFKLISDHHFGHDKMFSDFEPIRSEYAKKRGKDSLQGFESLLIENWNKKVQKTDTIIHLGDFIINKRNKDKTIDNLKKSTKRLNGRKILIKGNHDKLNNQMFIDSGWDMVIDKPLILLDGKEIKLENEFPNYTGCIITEINGKRVMLSHFGVYRMDKRFEMKYEKEFDYLTDLYLEYDCELNFHGHSHSKDKNTNESINCSVENMNFTPLSITELLLRNN